MTKISHTDTSSLYCYCFIMASILHGPSSFLHHFSVMPLGQNPSNTSQTTHYNNMMTHVLWSKRFHRLYKKMYIMAVISSNDFYNFYNYNKKHAWKFVIMIHL